MKTKIRRPYHINSIFISPGRPWGRVVNSSPNFGGWPDPICGAKRCSSIHAAAKRFQFRIRCWPINIFYPLSGASHGPRGEQTPMLGSSVRWRQFAGQSDCLFFSGVDVVRQAEYRCLFSSVPF